MRVAGVPLWALVLGACVVAPFLIRAWIDAEHRRAKKRTAALLQGIVTPAANGDSRASEETPLSQGMGRRN